MRKLEALTRTHEFLEAILEECHEAKQVAQRVESKLDALLGGGDGEADAGVEELKCPECGKGPFKNARALRAHHRMHEGG